MKYYLSYKGEIVWKYLWSFIESMDLSKGESDPEDSGFIAYRQLVDVDNEFKKKQHDKISAELIKSGFAIHIGISETQLTGNAIIAAAVLNSFGEQGALGVKDSVHDTLVEYRHHTPTEVYETINKLLQDKYLIGTY